MKAHIIMQGIMINGAAERLSNTEAKMTNRSSPPHRAVQAVTPYLNTGRRQGTAITSPADSILCLRNISRAIAENAIPTAK